MEEKSVNSVPAVFKMKPEDALQVLCAALQGGTLKLPFGGSFHEKLSECLENGDFRAGIILKGLDGGKVISRNVAANAAVYAQADVVYLLTLFAGLQRGISAQELTNFFTSVANESV